MRLGQRRVEVERARRRSAGAIHVLLHVPQSGARRRLEHVGIGQADVREREVGRTIDGPSEEVDGLVEALGRAPIPRVAAAQEEVVHRRVDIRRGPARPARQSGDSALNGGGDRVGDIALELDHVVQAAVVQLGPEVGVGGGVDELGGDSDPLAGLQHRPLDDQFDAERLRDIRNRGAAGFVVAGSSTGPGCRHVTVIGPVADAHGVQVCPLAWATWQRTEAARAAGNASSASTVWSNSALV